MKKTGICPKCGSEDFIKIKDIFHSNGGGNISKARNFFYQRNTALITFYVCEKCGYVEEYLDKEELEKLKK